jgi:L-iditol 2-dehydrogenase
MKAAVLTEIKKIEFKDLPKPEPKNGEALVKVKHVGVCGSDVHYYEHGRIGNFIVKQPLILGHECAGEIVALGRHVKGGGLKIGDTVALEPGVTCGRCEFCMEGRYNLCPDVAFMATPPVDGAFAEYVAHPAHLCFKLPAGMDTVEGALIEPLSVAFQAVAQAQVEPGRTATVLGAGCIGLVTVMALINAGVTKIHCVDAIAKRLAKAGELGATPVDLTKTDSVAEILRQTGNRGTDYVFEASGNATAIRNTGRLVARGGTIIMIGLSADGNIGYDFNSLIDKEASIKTVFRYANHYRSAIDAVASGRINIKNLVSDYYPFDEVAQAFITSVERKSDVIKIVIKM